MATYKKMIDKRMLGKRFLISSSNRKSLFLDKKHNRYEIHLHSNGTVSTSRVDENGERIPAPELDTLRKIGKLVLSNPDPSVNQVRGLLITAEIEVERIFNSLRFKYLYSLLKADKKYQPGEYITSYCNYLFNAMTHRPIRGTKKQDMKKKWKEVCLYEGMPANSFIDVSNEKSSLEFILNYFLNNFEESEFYPELIAIKPGFHEVYMDKVHGFEHGEGIEGKDFRADIFRRIHRMKPVRKKHPPAGRREINAHRFLGYAPCNVTEGPFYYRKSPRISAFAGLRKIPKRATARDFEVQFNVLDYMECLTSTKKLTEFLGKAKAFLTYP
jgi:hypothetical protein